MSTPPKSWWSTPQTGIERVLFEAAWENERAINLFRVFFGLLLGIPSVIWMIGRDHLLFGSAWSVVGWALCGVALIPVLRRTYHRALSFVLTTLDATAWMAGLYWFYLGVKANNPG